jgi:AP-1 complex subunit gamma-1
MMQPASGSVVNSITTMTQLMKVENPTKAPIRLRIKLSYATTTAGVFDEVVDCTSFDPALWQ